MDSKPDQEKQPEMSFKDKIMMLFCGRGSSRADSQPIIIKKEQDRKMAVIKKEPRQTLNIDDPFLKLSRKNIVEEQFFSHEILNLQVQRHLASRLKHCYFGLIKGDFTQQSIQSIKFPIFLTEKPTKTIPYRQQIKASQPIKIRTNSLDVIVYQTSSTRQLGNKSKKPKVMSPQIKQTLSRSKTNIQKSPKYQIEQILEMLRNYRNCANNILIVCSKEIEPLNFSKEFLEFSKDYMFELERVRQNQQLICNIIYMSNNPHFLKINDKSFKQFLISEMELNMEQCQRMEEILNRLLLQNYHKQVVNTIRLLKRDSVTQRSLFQSFVVKISSQNQKIRKILTQMKSLIFFEQSLQYTPQLAEPTPIFSHQKNEM